MLPRIRMIHSRLVTMNDHRSVTLKAGEEHELDIGNAYRLVEEGSAELLNSVELKEHHLQNYKHVGAL